MGIWRRVVWDDCAHVFQDTDKQRIVVKMVMNFRQILRVSGDFFWIPDANLKHISTVPFHIPPDSSSTAILPFDASSSTQFKMLNKPKINQSAVSF
jgi:hypothetical protein